MTARKRNVIQPGDGDPRHGTLGGYTNNKCRGECCRVPFLNYQRYKRSTSTSTSPTHRLMTTPKDHLAVECWCRVDIVHVPQSEVTACRTRSCGRPGCNEKVMEAAV
jgi:hypothetical protein